MVPARYKEKFHRSVYASVCHRSITYSKLDNLRTFDVTSNNAQEVSSLKTRITCQAYKMRYKTKDKTYEKREME